MAANMTCIYYSMSPSSYVASFKLNSTPRHAMANRLTNFLELTSLQSRFLIAKKVCSDPLASIVRQHVVERKKKSKLPPLVPV